ncbi:MAG: ribonuclease HII [Candidatus Amulumruptor caecigallinarius]|nr:ribonuclease HII [Candidatus Amulumruptor caecigallinarius]MCM1396597.1 ribonuclease HII [Candidatus Amulumruptor caecigallinarius]MCM1453345.1 ribonuclease HII [bacterium]
MKLHEPLPPRLDPSVLEAGCDEAGRGCLAGPVVAAAVILPADFSHPLLNDSKQLSEARREALRPVIEAEAIAWGIGVVEAPEIDRINILNASILAMHRALDVLKVRPEAIVVDGNRFKPYGDVPWQTVVKGDGKLANIAAASVLAKTERDHIMLRLHEEYPAYNWADNKGYPTPAHREAIRHHGVTPQHRQSFTLLPPEQLSLEF